MTIYTQYQNSIFDLITIRADNGGLSGLWLNTQLKNEHLNHFGQRDDDHPLLLETIAQLEAYFAGTLTDFDLPLSLQGMGTPFQQQVWQALITIPYGETWSYQQLATKINNPKAVRAVGAANGKNPISIIVPCHRVIGKNGTLTGYAGGVDMKQKLLDIESKRIKS